PKSDWYVWADPKPDGSPPNNWQAVFAGPSWTWDSRRSQYYFHNFLSSQPDLNLHNPDVQEAILDVATYWMDRGVDGVRLDAINFAMHDPQLRDNPPAPFVGERPQRTFDLQRHVHNQSHPDIVLFLERLRGVFDRYGDRFSLAEIGGLDAFQEMLAFTSGGTRLNSAYSFDYLYADNLTASLVRTASSNWPTDPDAGWPSWAFSNHDAPRCISRWHDGSDPHAFAKLVMQLLITLRGNAIIYQGEELGLPQADVPFERLQDPEALANWPQTLGRDGARTPFPWQKTAPHAGFSSFNGDTWLPIDARHVPLAVDQQDDDPASVLYYVRRMLALRRSAPALSRGDITFLDTPDMLVAFERSIDGARWLCVHNLSAETVDWVPDTMAGQVLLSTYPDHADAGDARELPQIIRPFEGYVAELA
ncbi:MAG: alpha-amylase family glycosyl hydrolase, partial [Pseudomonadota bacterium]